jgi:hypothetical protein
MTSLEIEFFVGMSLAGDGTSEKVLSMSPTVIINRCSHFLNGNETSRRIMVFQTTLCQSIERCDPWIKFSIRFLTSTLNLS